MRARIEGRVVPAIEFLANLNCNHQGCEAPDNLWPGGRTSYSLDHAEMKLIIDALERRSCHHSCRKYCYHEALAVFQLVPKGLALQTNGRLFRIVGKLYRDEIAAAGAKLARIECSQFFCSEFFSDLSCYHWM